MNNNYEKTFYLPFDAIRKLIRLLPVYIFVIRNQMNGVREYAIARTVTIALVHSKLAGIFPVKESQNVSEDGYRTISISETDVIPLVDSLLHDSEFIATMSKVFGVFGARREIVTKWTQMEMIQQVAQRHVIYTLHPEGSAERAFINYLKSITSLVV